MYSLTLLELVNSVRIFEFKFLCQDLFVNWVLVRKKLLSS